MKEDEKDSDCRSKLGPIPQRWFEDDHDPNPERLEAGTPAKERNAFIERLRKSAPAEDKGGKR